MDNLNNVKKKSEVYASALKGCDLLHMKNKTKLVCVSLLFLHKASVFNLPDLPRPGQKKKNENVLEKCFF